MKCSVFDPKVMCLNLGRVESLGRRHVCVGLLSKGEGTRSDGGREGKIVILY